MQLTTWRPLQEMDNIFGRHARLFNPGFPALFDTNGSGDVKWTPTADISESKKEYLVKAELPDVDRSDIHVSVDDGVLTIKGERKHRKEHDDETIHRVESFYGEFIRSFSLPTNVDISKIAAESKNGILRVHLPKSKETPATQPTKIKVE